MVIERDISIDEIDLGLLNKITDAHIRRLRGQIKQLKNCYTGKCTNTDKQSDLECEIENCEELLAKLAEPFI